ncbi:hypothetical protein E4U13_005670 [Claviceps humidiphila]|uniref:ribonuclease H n=1 Tax=Claviceps humidiphila TaxID=1294629 RepID=A0A9P7TQZ8_9HYPO|nr:hypothetical protein E4U13_005670 [Claviceps humidiphila]
MVRTPHERHQDQLSLLQTRSFDPYLHLGGMGIDEVEICDFDEDWTYVACIGEPCKSCGTRDPHISSIVISVDGACSGNGTADAFMAAGVFFNTNSRYNQSLPLYGPSVTNQVAELRAGILALELAMDIWWDERFGEDGDQRLREVVIKADSDYLVKGMTDYIFKWKQNGFLTTKRTPVTNRALFEELEALVNELNSMGIDVYFWHVPRSFNQSADRLAKMASKQT